MLIAQNPTAYVVAYLALMVPTYILPYFGSNSTLINAFSTALGMGPTPQWWAHVWFLTMLALLGWLRGNAIGKSFLPLFPVLAGVFDIVPGLSVIPLVPTLLHIAGIVLGVTNISQSQTETISEGGIAVLRKAKMIAGMATLVAISGSILFVSTMGRNVKSLISPEAPSMTKAPAHKRVPAPQPHESVVSKPFAPQAIAAEADTPSVAPQPPKVKPPIKAAKSQPIYQRAETKPTVQEKQTVRYIKLND